MIKVFEIFAIIALIATTIGLNHDGFTYYTRKQYSYACISFFFSGLLLATTIFTLIIINL